MKEIAIIIPCYNSLNTISDTLASIAMQSIKSKCHIYLCDDCGEDNYGRIIASYSNLLYMTYLRLPKNSGAGMARQFGIDNSKEPYIVFIDSDDTFVTAFAIEMLHDKMIKSGSDLVCGNFIADTHGDNGIEFTEYSKAFTWLHGKMYRREFLGKWNIRFIPELRYDEDAYFNQLCACYEAQTSYIQENVYLWTTNKNSLTRSPDFPSRFNTC